MMVPTSSMLATVKASVLQSAVWLWTNTPTWAGGYQGKEPAEICAMMTNVAAKFWEPDLAECTDLIEKNILSKLVLIAACYLSVFLFVIFPYHLFALSFEWLKLSMQQKPEIRQSVSTEKRAEINQKTLAEKNLNELNIVLSQRLIDLLSGIKEDNWRLMVDDYTRTTLTLLPENDPRRRQLALTNLIEEH